MEVGERSAAHHETSSRATEAYEGVEPSEDESLDLVASLMAWKRIRHVPVEDDDHHLVGLVSYRSLLELLAKHGMRGVDRQTPVSAIMKKEPVTVSPDASILDAIALMGQRRIAALPVVKDGRLMGIITERDFMNMAAELLSEQLDRLKD